MEHVDLHGAKESIDRILSNSKYYVYVVSPYIRFSHFNTKLDAYIKTNIEDVASKKVDVNIIFRKQRLTRFILKRSFKKVDNVSLMQCENLHSKIYLNESEALITSLNLLTSSMKANHETGIVIKRDTHEDLWQQCYNQVKQIKKESQLVKSLRDKK